MSDAANQRSGGGSGTAWAVAVSVALVLYPLSPAPLVKLIESIYGRHPPEKVVATFRVLYYPVFQSMEKSTAARRFYEWYFRLWGL
jgi:hypothetical protein